MFGIGMPELIVILVIGLIFFGPGKLPDLGSSIGKAIRGFKKAMDEPEKKPEEPRDGKVTIKRIKSHEKCKIIYQIQRFHPECQPR